MTLELRIRKIFRPVSYLISTILVYLNVLPNTVAIFSFILAIITFSIFLAAYNISPLLAEAIMSFAALCIFLNGLLDDVIRDIEEKTGRKSEFGGILGSFLDRYSDTFIVLGIGVFLKDVPWYDIGLLINIGPEGHLFLVFLIIIGSLIVSYIRADNPAYELGLESRAERMYLLSIFAGVGIISGRFQGMLFLGLVALCLSLYAEVIHTIVIPKTKSEEIHEIKPKTYSSYSNIGYRFFSIIKGLFNKIGDLLRFFWMILGVVILESYRIITWTATHIKNLKIQRPNIQDKIERKRPTSTTPKSRKFERNSFTVLVLDDNTEAPVADAKVILSSEETGKINTNYTDNTGIVIFRNINEGSYEIEVESQGYEKESRNKYLEPHSGGEAFSLSPISEVFEDTIQEEEKKTEEIKPEIEEDKELKPEPEEPVKETTKTKKPKPTAAEIKEEEEDETKALGESMLVKYSPPETSDTVAEQIAEFYLSENRSVLLASSQPSLKQYKDKFKTELENEEIILIHLFTEDSPNQKTDDIKEIPLTMPEYFSKELDEISPGSVVIFEPLSTLIEYIGTSKSQNYISQTIDRLSRDGISFIAFLNEENHNKKDMIAFEELFMNLARIEDGKLRKMSGL